MRRVGHYFSAHPLGRKITQLQGDSREFDFRAFYGKADLIFIDANHDYAYVKSDSAEALKMLSERGTVIWHDYPNSLGVSECLSELKCDLALHHIWETTLACYSRASKAGA
ncbi:MAG: class I SAM-dependent methyltransferase [Chloroflexi bacterium]|nr:MAG: class I SAM-dependent methyltransferase [Chloroflexota bacterium]